MPNDPRFDSAHQPGTPAGMAPSDVHDRTEIGKWFGKDLWPATTREAQAKAQELGAPAEVVELLNQLPNRTFRNTQDLVQALGIGVEQRRQ
ncbi:MAG: DUF2795 domain-containing protein [Actinomycetes bacterium]|jgi:hypothetical protein